MTASPHFRKTAIAATAGLLVAAGMAACGGGGGNIDEGFVGNEWMRPSVVARQNQAGSDTAREAVANQRAKLLIAAMTPAQKMQQLTGSLPEVLPELPECYGARHVTSIPSLNIPTFRITNGPVGLGQNDCVSKALFDKVQAGAGSPFAAYTDASSAKATALPSAIGTAASFDPAVATAYGDVIGTEMNNLALHVFEAPGVNLARLPILGRNFEYFGEDPYLTGAMAVAEVKAVQAKGLIGMPKHFVGNEQETNRQKIQETIDPQVMRELYLLPFEMAVKDGKAASVMCAYNYVNGVQSCENEELLTKVLRNDWGFTGYVQSDFFAIKSTAATMRNGLDHEMPIPQFWSVANLTKALADGSITAAMFDRSLERRYTQMFKWGIFDRALKQTPIDFAANGQKARDIGAKAAVLLQNNGALPLATSLARVVVVGKASQVYAQQAVAGGSLVGKAMGSGGGSSDVVPNYTVTPVAGIQNALKAAGNASATVQLILVDDANANATIDGVASTFAQATAAAAAADAVVLMAGSISEEGADRATVQDGSSLATATVPLAPGASAADGTSLDWYAPASLTTPATATGANGVKNSNTVAMIKAVMGAASSTSKSMAQKTTLVLKDNAGVAMDPALVGSAGPAMLEVWFPGQEDGNIVADLLFGKKNPSGKLPVTMPFAGKGFLDHLTAAQFPGVVGADGVTQTVTYSEQLNIGYRWYDANVSGQCAVVNGSNPCVAFPFGHGLSYTNFNLAAPSVTANAAGGYDVKATVRNAGGSAGAEVVQVYLSLPASASAVGVAQPPKRLVGFQKVELAAGGTQEVTVSLQPAGANHPLSVWNKATNAWVTPAGQYTVYVGRSSAPKDLVVAGSFSK
ncbi:MAG: glycosyl hydrolase [Rhodoferax sp.]|nr:glycosyl hydrolase [Rhodoferax sp.]